MREGEEICADGISASHLRHGYGYIPVAPEFVIYLPRRVSASTIPGMLTARDLAFRILRQWKIQQDPPLLPERADPVWQQVPARERPFAFDLLTGVLRWRNALDAVIASRLKQPLETLDVPVRAILWIGAYQLLIQGGTANYAAVDTAVELARKNSATAKASGLVNAVLRGITRLNPRRIAVDKALSPIERLSRRVIALDFSTQLFFNADVFPDPATEATAHLAAVRSHTALFVDHLRKIFGDALAADLLLRNNQRPVITFRADAAALDVPASAGLVAHASAERFLVAAEGWNDAIEKLVAKGTLSPQDPTSARPVRRAAQFAQPGAAEIPASPAWPPKRILDLCAGLGTKSLQLARAFPDAAVTATDIDAGKLERLAARAQQVKQKNIATAPLERLAPAAAPDARFDLVLVDAPCSNTGVMAKRVQSRWRWPSLNHEALATLQRQLLEQAAALLAPGGVLIYATCSIDPAENQDRVKQFLATHPDFKTVAEESTLPSLEVPADATHDGGYFAILAAAATHH